MEGNQNLKTSFRCFKYYERVTQSFERGHLLEKEMEEKSKCEKNVSLMIFSRLKRISRK